MSNAYYDYLEHQRYVLTCKECKFYDDINKRCRRLMFTSWLDIRPDPEKDFCSWAEKEKIDEAKK